MAWIVYDQNFGQEVANNPEQSWAKVDPVAIVLAAALWGHQWAGLTVKAECDEAVVAILNQGSSWSEDVMHLMRCLAFVAAKSCLRHI